MNERMVVTHIAALIRFALISANDDLCGAALGFDEGEAVGRVTALTYIAKEFAAHIAVSNPHFDRDRFLMICGVEE